MAKKKKSATATITLNRKARHNYTIEETFEAGIVLTGPEVKSLRLGRVNIEESYADVDNDGVVLINAHIAPYTQARDNAEPRRNRRLLLHKREIRRLAGAVTRQGRTIVPLNMHWQRGRAKVSIALTTGKRQYDKRQDIKSRDWQRQKARLMARKSQA